MTQLSHLHIYGSIESEYKIGICESIKSEYSFVIIKLLNWVKIPYCDLVRVTIDSIELPTKYTSILNKSHFGPSKEFDFLP